MKKYLITGMAAIVFCGAFTSCSHDLDSGGGGTAANSIEETYEKAFITHFGEPAPTQTWGFGSSSSAARALTRGHNANANEWADPDPSKTYGGWIVPDPLKAGQKLRVQKYFQYNQYPGGTTCNYTDFFVQQVYKGGTDPLTKYDKTIVNDTLKYSEEKYKSANGGWVVGSDHMDHLTAGSIHDHINNFNYGEYSGGGTVNVLDSAQHVGGTTHPDQIMLMVQSQTDCFGYWNSDGSLGHDHRYRLVSAKTIDDWIDEHTDLGFGPDYGVRVQDHWNRGFIGFDFDQVVGDDILQKTNVVYGEGGKVTSYDIAYAKYSDSPAGNSQYMAVEDDITSRFIENLSSLWGKDRGETASLNNDNIIVYNGVTYGGLAIWIGGDWSAYGKMVVEFAKPTSINTQILIQRNGGEYTSVAEAGATKLELDFNGKDMTGITNVALQPADNGTIYIKKIYLLKPESFNTDQYVYNGQEQVPYLMANQNMYCGIHVLLPETDVKATLNNQQCVIKTKIDEMVSAGYLPISGTQFKEWVKVQGGADGYFSDWIVTIAEAKSYRDNPPPSNDTEIVVIAEDLTIDDAIPDFDFNDVVFKVKWNKTANTVNVELLAAGGTLPLYIGGTDGVFTDGVEVHAKFAEVNPDKVITTGTMINTWAGRHTEYKTPTFEVTNFNHSATTIGEVAASIKVAVRKYDALHELVAPEGHVPTKIAVKTDFVTDPNMGWCDERQDIDDKYNVDGTPLFKSYVIGTLDDNWYRQIHPLNNN